MKQTKDEEISKEEIAELVVASEKIDAVKKVEAESNKEKNKGLFNREEVQKMIEEALKKDKAQGQDDLDEVDPYAQKKLTIPRFPTKDGVWKFVVGFANTNTDEFFKDKIIQAFDIWDDMQKKNVPYVKAVFEDGTEMTLPLHTIVKKSQKVTVDIVETVKTDKSYSAGRTDKVTVDGYASKSEGSIVLKVTKFDYSFIVKLPDGKEIGVDKCVVNWMPATN